MAGRATTLPPRAGGLGSLSGGRRVGCGGVCGGGHGGVRGAFFRFLPKEHRLILADDGVLLGGRLPQRSVFRLQSGDACLQRLETLEDGRKVVLLRSVALWHVQKPLKLVLEILPISCSSEKIS